MQMEFEQMITLIKTVSESNLANFTMEQEGIKISMKTDKGVKYQTVTPEISVQPMAAAVPAAAGEAAGQMQEDRKLVKSPLVGTFYNAESPESEPFVKVGDRVEKGQTLGIVEAMKLMNEIECEYDGVVKEILVENEQMVEYKQPLFVIG